MESHEEPVVESNVEKPTEEQITSAAALTASFDPTAPANAPDETPEPEPLIDSDTEAHDHGSSSTPAAATEASAPVEPEPVVTLDAPLSPLAEDAGAATEAPDLSIPVVVRSQHDAATEALGVGGRIEIEAAGFRVATGGRPVRFGHGATIEEALHDLTHPASLPVSVE